MLLLCHIILSAHPLRLRAGSPLGEKREKNQRAKQANRYSGRGKGGGPFPHLQATTGVAACLAGRYFSFLIPVFYLFFPLRSLVLDYHPLTSTHLSLSLDESAAN